MMRIYGLKEKPTNPDEFFRLLKAESAKHPGARKFIARVKSKEAVIGRCGITTKDWTVMHGTKEKIFTLCSYDTLMTGVLQGSSEIGSSCPHCGQTMSVRIRAGHLERFSPKGMVFYWGTGPEGSAGNPMCDHLHLFPDKSHMDEWVESQVGEMGFSYNVQEAIQRLKGRF